MALSFLKKLYFLLDPKVRVDLMLEAASENHPFFARVTKDFWAECNARHPKFPLLRHFKYGVALCVLPPEFKEYFALVNPAARRNLKKAEREGFEFARIDFNDHLDDISEIRSSTQIRQGKVPDSYIKGEVKRCTDPPSKTNLHDYPYFGILKDGKLCAYCGCFVAGEVMLIQHILGHADFQNAGIVPMMIIKTAEYCLEHYPRVLYYGYGSYYGARSDMRRFKKKFLFSPHVVDWLLDRAPSPPQKPDDMPPADPGTLSSDNYQNVYRLENPRPFSPGVRNNVRFVALRSFTQALIGVDHLTRLYGVSGMVKALLKAGTARRFFYMVLEGDEVVSTGWCTKAPCKHYKIEPEAVMIGPIWTSPEHRRRGFASFALKNAVNECLQNGHRLIYIDTSKNNIAAQKTFAKCGFGDPVYSYPKNV